MDRNGSALLQYEVVHYFIHYCNPHPGIAEVNIQCSISLAHYAEVHLTLLEAEEKQHLRTVSGTIYP